MSQVDDEVGIPQGEGLGVTYSQSVPCGCVIRLLDVFTQSLFLIQGSLTGIGEEEVVV